MGRDHIVPLSRQALAVLESLPRTNQKVDLIKHQLAHVVKDANGQAYNRTTHLPARKEMMQVWADYLDTLRVGTEVIQLPIKTT